MGEHIIKITVSDEEKEKLFRIVGERGVTVEDLFECVISDLVGQGNGSDERYLMDRWLDRCFLPEETLLKYFLEVGYNVDDVLTAWDERGYYEQFPDEEDKPDWIEEDLHEYLDEYREEHPEADIPEQIEICRRWLEEKERF